MEAPTTGAHDADTMASFLSLPPEIRVQIYRELFHNQDLEDPRLTLTDEVDDHLLFGVKIRSYQPSLIFLPSQQHKITSPILRTSSTIYREASEVLYKEASFRYYCRAYLFGDPSTLGFPNKTLHRVQHLGLVIKTLHYVHAFSNALQYFSKRACFLKTLHLDLYVGANPETLDAIDPGRFGDRIHDFGPKLERISIAVIHLFPSLDLDDLVQKWSSAIGWDICKKEEIEGFISCPSDFLELSKIPKWTFRPPKDLVPDGGK